MWGGTYERVRDGMVDRSSAGVHICPQDAAARFTHWLHTELAKLFPGFTLPGAQDWADTGWSTDKRFKGC